MFDELIAQGNDMIRRQQAEVGLSAYSAENIPDDQRVTIIEANAWRVAVEDKIQNTFGPDAYARYKETSPLGTLVSGKGLSLILQSSMID